MADFTLKKRKDFTFALESDPKKTYTIPAASNLGFEEAQMMANFADGKTIVEQGERIKGFILKHVPELAEKGLCDMEYYEILNAYIEFGKKENLGES